MSSHAHLFVLSFFLVAMEPQAHAHSMDQIKAEFSQMHEEPSEEIIQLTIMHEKMKSSAEGEMAHNAQHDLLYRAKRRSVKEGCATLLAKIPLLERKITKLENDGRQEEAEKLAKEKDKIQAFTQVNCNFID